MTSQYGSVHANTWVLCTSVVWVGCADPHFAVIHCSLNKNYQWDQEAFHNGKQFSCQEWMLQVCGGVFFYIYIFFEGRSVGTLRLP